MQRTIFQGCLCGILWALGASLGSAQEIQSLLLRIKAVGKEGAGNIEAAKAWKEIVRSGPAVLPEVLAGFDDASPSATNWLRAAVEAIQDRALQNDQKLPADRIEAFLCDSRHCGSARRLAYECLVRLDPTTPDRLLAKFLDDPAAELRRDAVAVKIEHGQKSAFSTTVEHKEYFTNLLRHARDRDQVQTIRDELKKLGVEIDLTRHYGFVTHWLVAGPFDNTKGVGFQNAYPPEKGVDAGTTYAGKDHQTVRWKAHTTTRPLGLVDFNEVIGKLKGVAGYGYAVVSSESERPVELRAASNNAIRIWLNGKEVYFREEYHHGVEMDQHVGKGTLKMGNNEILVKVCQNEQTDSWAQLWSFQLRVCDALGAAVPVVSVTEKKK